MIHQALHILSLAILALSTLSSAQEASYTNPILPGWHSDPSCIFVPELDDTFFCTTSTFIAFPGLPIYASKDLINWRLASNALSRIDQIPNLAHSHGSQQEGTYANTIRYRDGILYLITPYLSMFGPIEILLFKTADPFDDAAWSDPIRIDNPSGGGDPDLFWDEDGKLYISQSFNGEHGGIWTSEVDVHTGEVLDSGNPWNGTGGRWPEGPHIYKKDGIYYLAISEGGTELLHKFTISRSTSIWGPYEPIEANPILTNAGTNEYFQCIGHADLFQDSYGSWWGVALASRSGPEWQTYPMGRETVLFPAIWNEGEWPVLDQVRGRMQGPLPPKNTELPGSIPLVSDSEFITFKPGTELPRNWHHWRSQLNEFFEISPAEAPNALRITPSMYNLTGDAQFEPSHGIAFVGRTQSHTLFNFSISVSFEPAVGEEEAGITLFLTQYQHIDLGIVGTSASNASSTPHLRFRATTLGKSWEQSPETSLIPIPDSWRGEEVYLKVSAIEENRYRFAAAAATHPEKEIEMGFAAASLMSGGSGPFSGTLVGIYATANGGSGKTPAYFREWSYKGIAQKVDHNEWVWSDEE